MRSVFRAFISHVLPPVVALLLVLTVWQLTTAIFKIERFLLPGPLLVLEAARKHWDELLSGFLITGGEAVVGFLASLIIGTLIACLFSQSRLIRTSLFPYAIFLQTVPIVAIAPLIGAMIGFINL